MRKTALVITFLGFENYGAYLQSYGIYNLLREKGYHNIFFHNPALTRIFPVNRNYLKPSNFLSFIRRLKYFVSIKKTFGNIYPSCPRAIKTLSKIIKKKSLVLFGSDQVINRNCYEGNQAINDWYFRLASENINVCGLAMSHRDPSSMSLSTSEQMFIKNMPIATCREDSLVQHLRRQYNIQTSFCPDPSFFLEKKDILSLVVGKNGLPSPVNRGILITGYNIDAWLDTTLISSYHNKTYLNYEWRKLFTFKSICIKSPEAIYRDFFQHECIYTNSFHGVCLALILGKKIIVPSSEKYSGGDRVLQLIKEFGFRRFASAWLLEKADTQKLSSYKNQLLHTLEACIVSTKLPDMD